MKKIALSLALLIPFLPLKAEEAVDVVQELISSSEKNLKGQRRLLTSIESFYQAREAFIADSNNARIGTDLVQIAIRVEREMKEENLAHLFPTSFLEEVRFFSRVGKGKT